MALDRLYMTHAELAEWLDEQAQEAENANRHGFAGKLWQLAEHVSALNIGDTFFGVIDEDAWGNDAGLALVEIID